MNKSYRIPVVWNVPGQPKHLLHETLLNTEHCEAHRQSLREPVCEFIEESSLINRGESLQPHSANAHVSLPSNDLENKDDEKASEIPITPRIDPLTNEIHLVDPQDLDLQPEDIPLTTFIILQNDQTVVDTLEKITLLFQTFGQTPKTIIRHGINSRFWSFLWVSESVALNWNIWVMSNEFSKDKISKF